MDGLRSLVADLYLLIRFAALGFTLIVVLLGSATTADSSMASLSRTLGMLCIACCFHVYVYVLNDVIDLPIDRGDDTRQDDPLVRGAITPRAALRLAVVLLAIALLLTILLEGSLASLIALLTAACGMTVYNLWGKRMPFPPLTDLVQGASWGGLALFGATYSGAGVTRLSVALVAAIVVYILLINGVTGSLRDLANDWRSGARTTAILLGARPTGTGGFVIPRSLLGYGLTLQLLLLVVCGWSLVVMWPAHGAIARSAVASTYVVLAALTLALMLRAAQAGNRSDLIVSGTGHLLFSLGALALPFALWLSPGSLVILCGAYVVPVVAMIARNGLRWG